MKELFELVAAKTTTVADLKKAQERIFAVIAAKGKECEQIKKEIEEHNKEKHRLLLVAAEAGNTEIILAVIEFERELQSAIYKATGFYPEYSLHTQNNNGKNFIQLLIQNGDEDKVIKLIDELDELEKKKYDWFNTDVKYDLFRGSIKVAIKRHSPKILERLLNYQDLGHHILLDWISDNDLMIAVKADFHEGIKIVLRLEHYQKYSTNRVALFKSAVNRGSLESIKLLALPPCDINAVDEYGRTALHYAADSSKIDMEIIRFLIESGAKLDCYDKLQKTPLQLILDKEDLKLQQQLEQILKATKSNQEQYLDRIQSIESIQKRLAEINYATMDLRLFSHINLDAIFDGSPYEGMTMSSTSQYLLSQLKSKYFAETLMRIFESDRFRRSAAKIKARIQNFITDLESFHTISLFMDAALSSLILSESKYSSVATKKQGRNKLYEEVVEFIFSNIKRNGALNLIPGGYRSEENGQSGGHAMKYGLKFEKNCLIFTIYNTGDGLNQHANREEQDKLKYSPILEYRIPIEEISDEILKNLLRELIRLCFEPRLESKNYNAAELYPLIDEKLKKLKAEVMPTRENISFITGQRAGNCAWKIMQLMLKLSIENADSSELEVVEIDQEIYQILKFELHLQSLLEFYVTMLKFGKFATQQVQFPIKEAIYNLNRALYHKLPKEWTAAPGNEAYIRDLASTFQTIIATCTVLPPKRTDYKLYSVKEMLEFDKSFRKLGGSPKDVTESKAEKEASFLHYTPGESLGDAGLLVKMQQVEQQMNKMRQISPAITVKMFENLVNKVPIYSAPPVTDARKFWDKIKRDEAYQIMQCLCRMTRVYLCTSVRITPLLLPSNLVALYSVSFIQCKLQHILLGKGFRNHVYTVSEKCKDMLICHELSKLDVRFQELFEAESRLGFVLDEANWLSIATRYYTEDSLENLGYSFKKNDSKLKNRRIANIAEYGILSGWFFRQDLKPELLQDLDFYMLSNLLHHDIFGAVQGSSRQIFDEGYLPFPSDPSKFRNIFPKYHFGLLCSPDPDRAEPNDSIKVSITEKDWRQRYEEFGSRGIAGNSKHAALIHKRDILFSKNFSFTTDSTYLHAMKGERSIEKRFDFGKFRNYNRWDLESSSASDPSLSSNKIQAHIIGDLTRKASKRRQILHTRTERETTPSETIDSYFSELSKLKSPIHRTLISCNFLNPGQMLTTLDLHPEFAAQLLDFIEQGLKHHIDDSYIDHAVPYLFKLNIILIDYLKLCELRASKASKIYGETRIRVVDNIKGLSKILRNFMSASEALTSKEKRIEARLLCRKMHLNLVHLIVIEFYYLAQHTQISTTLPEELSAASNDKIIDLFKALLYLGTHPVDLQADGNDEDPTGIDFISEAMYYCAPHLKTVLENLNEKEPDTLLKAVKDVIKDIYPIIDKSHIESIHFPILKLAVKTGNVELTINCLEGTVVNRDLKLKDLPLWVYKDEGFRSVFGPEPRQGFVSESEEIVMFTVSEGENIYRYRLEKGDVSDFFYGSKPNNKFFKEIEIEGEKRWYSFSLYEEHYFPKFLYDKTMVTWAALSLEKEEHDKVLSLVFAKKTGQNLYYYSMTDSKVYVLTKDGKVSKREILNASNNSEHPNPAFELFQAFDSLNFTRIERDKESNEILLEYLRYGVRFKSIKGGAFVWEQDSRYELVLNQKSEFIPGIDAPLHLKPREGHLALDELFLVPIQALIADPDTTGARADAEYFNPAQLDVFGMKQQDIFYWVSGIKDVKEEYREDHHFASKYWDLENSCQFATYSLKGQEKTPTAHSAEDALFLSYLQFGCKHYESAFQNLEHAKSLGFEGSRQELEIISQIFLSVPYQFLSDAMKSLHSKTDSLSRASQVSNAFTVAYKTRILAIIYQHIAMGGKFCFKSRTQDKASRQFTDAYETGITTILQKIFDEDTLESFLEQTLHEYHQSYRNIPESHQLKSDELILLLGRLKKPFDFETAKYQYYLEFYRNSILKAAMENSEAITNTDLIPLPKLKAKALSLPSLLQKAGIQEYQLAKIPETVELEPLLLPTTTEGTYFVESQLLLNRDFKKGVEKNLAHKLMQYFYIKELDVEKRKILQNTLEVLVNDCNNTITERRQKLISLANANSLKTKLEIDASFRHLAAGKLKLSFEDIIELYRKRSYKLYAEKTALLPADIETLFADTFQYFLELNQSKQYKRALDLLKEINALETDKDGSDLFLNSLAEFVQIVLAELNYDLYYKNHQTIIFECEENILVRPAQQHHIHELTRRIDRKPQHYAYKAQMGDGKSTVINPMASYLCADGEHLIEIDAPSELLPLMAKDHKRKAKLGFDQEVVLFEFHRGSDSRLPNLRNMRDKFLSLVHHRGCLDASPVTKQSLRLKWLDMLGSKDRKEHYEEILLLDDILELSEERGVVLVDELELESNPKKELNFTSSSPEAIADSEIDLVLKLYFDILEKFSVKDLKLTDLISGESLSTSEIHDLKRSMLKHLFELPDTITQLKLDSLDQSELITFTEYLFGNSEKMPAFILAKLEQIDLLNKKLLRLIPLEPNKEERQKIANDLKQLKDYLEIVAFYKAEITEIFPIAAAKRPFVAFGYSKDSSKSSVDRRFAIPYFGNNTPNERAKFASHLVTQGLTVQLNLLFGVLPEVMKCFLEEVLEAANKERDKSFGLIISIDDTPAARKFYALTGLEASLFPLRSIACDTPEFMATAKKIEVVKFCLKKYVLPHLKIHRRILRQNAQDYTSLAAYIRGCSGTFESIFMLDERLRQNYNADLYEGIDGQTLEFLLRKDKKAKVYPASEMDAFVEITAILTQNPNCKAIMDAAALFQGILNLTVAKSLAQFFKTSHMLYILFFNEQDKLCALSIADPEASPKILRGSHRKIVAEDLKCSPKDYFVYYDQLRCKGIDLRHMPFARGLVTVGAKTKLNEVLQAGKRMRDATHAVDFLISKQFMASCPEITEWTLRDVFKATFKTQVDSVLLDNYRVALQKIHALLRSKLLVLLRREKIIQRKFRIYDILAENGYIYSEISSSLFANFGPCTKETYTEILLNKAANDEYKRFSDTLSQIADIVAIDSIMPSELMKIQTSLNTIVQEAIKVCKDTMTSSVNDYLDSEVEVIGVVESTSTSQAQAQTLSVSQNESQTETLHASSKATPVKEEPLEYRFSIYQLNLIELTKSKSLNSYIGHLCSGFQFSPCLLVSKRFWESCREQNMKQVDIYTKTPMYILFCQQHPHLIAFFITEKEALKLAENMRYYERDKAKSKNHIWICTRKGLLFAGEPPKGSFNSPISGPSKLSKEVAEILEQSWFFAGDIYWLALKAQQGDLCWLTKENGDLEFKLKFFEKYILSLHPESIEMYQRYKVLFTSQKTEVEINAAQEELDIQESDESIDRENRVRVKKFA